MTKGQSLCRIDLRVDVDDRIVGPHGGDYRACVPVRRAWGVCFGALDCYYTPFLPPPRVGNRFGGKAFKEIDPANNQGLNVVPQLMSKNADEFVWAAQVPLMLGYREVNLNLGCLETGCRQGQGLGFCAISTSSRRLPMCASGRCYGVGKDQAGAGE